MSDLLGRLHAAAMHFNLLVRDVEITPELGAIDEVCDELVRMRQVIETWREEHDKLEAREALKLPPRHYAWHPCDRCTAPVPVNAISPSECICEPCALTGDTHD